VLLEKGDEGIDRYQDDFLETLSAREQTVVVVSNEVGMGVVPESPLGRKFRDLSGQINQKIAAMADKVIFLTAGLPMVLKGAP
jgi:adenosylcobinamide kinase/adenosylcobinamide-phosphate guanylyltransferase